jgi:polyphosphate kinase 2 (PPK2 family)
MLERTSTSWAPWTVVPATDKRYRRLRVFETLNEAFEKALERHHERTSAPKKPPRATAKKLNHPTLDHTVLDDVDLKKKLAPARYEKELERWQDRLRELEFACYAARVPVIVAYEGWDAAGKGGNIKRLVGSLDPRGYSVIPVAAPKGDRRPITTCGVGRAAQGGALRYSTTRYGRVMVERASFCPRPSESRVQGSPSSSAHW